MIPWLAQNYTAAANLMSYNFTLRSGITFADGEPLNSSAVYFSMNRLLIEDGSAPFGHGVQASWIIQQLENTSLSSTLCGCSQNYSAAWVNEVLAQNFIQITGPLTFRVNVLNPNSAFEYLFTGSWADIVAPTYTMQHDLALWKQPSSDYTLPHDTLSGNLTNQITQYFDDEAATCNAGSTPSGCGTTYLDGSYQGSQAGTGPYVLSSYSASTHDMVFQSNPNYWGGAYQFLGGQKIVPQIKTIDVNYVPEETTRELDLESAGRSGAAMIADIASTNLYDVASRTGWLDNNTLDSIISGVSIYGPYSGFAVGFYPFFTNVTNPLTGQFYQFQPFADLRFRLAFADAVNLSEINADENNNLGIVAPNGIPPGLPPDGSYNASIVPAYSYNPDEAAQLLLQAMEKPITQFTFENGTKASSGVFNNAFGCATLDSSGQCQSPISQTVPLEFDTGDAIGEAVMDQMASTINNISSTYNMGLTVSVVPVPSGTLYTYFGTDSIYFGSFTFTDDYPWVTDFTINFFAPNSPGTVPEGWNLTSMAGPWAATLNASAHGDLATIVKETQIMSELGNQAVIYLWTIYPLQFDVMTSNIHGLYYNPSIYDVPEGYYFATLY